MNIQQLKERWKGWREKRFLETHGCKTWREYEIRNDPDVGYIARTARTFYHGYPCILPIEAQGLRDYGLHGVQSYHDSIDQMMKWCEENCQGKWRNDWHRGFWDHQGNFEFNGVGGTDLMFFAFKEESDYVWFKLTWE